VAGPLPGTKAILSNQRLVSLAVWILPTLQFWFEKAKKTTDRRWVIQWTGGVAEGRMCGRRRYLR